MTDKKYLMFRQLSNEANNKEGRSFHAYGIVDEIYSEVAIPSGKEISVTYFNPITLQIERPWMNNADIEMFEVDKWEYEAFQEYLDLVERLKYYKTIIIIILMITFEN